MLVTGNDCGRASLYNAEQEFGKRFPLVLNEIATPWKTSPIHLLVHAGLSQRLRDYGARPAAKSRRR